MNMGRFYVFYRKDQYVVVDIETNESKDFWTTLDDAKISCMLHELAQHTDELTDEEEKAHA